ncbi:MAG: SDR family NAD(P)-dependent oxidoreductase, partial [Dietzia sp.]
MDIKGASVIVTGAASGLGNATARSFAEKGAVVFGLDLQQSIDKAVEQGIDEGITLIAADVTSEDDVKAAIARATEAAPLRVV